MATPRHSALDGPVPRLLAVGAALLVIGAGVWIGRYGFAGVPMTPFAAVVDENAASAVAANPELAACLTERVGAVDRMRSDGVIGDGQYATFRARAVAYCETQFPPQQ
ncbi:hypothetical protein [Stappia sp.]|uniref:hypothetical protein n=1 Tax=Stappia sp. TaxID=1870903 RepID=UPI0032D939FB